MSALEMIANALAAGAAVGVTDVASQSVRDTYAQLKARLGQSPPVAGVIAELEAERAEAARWRARLADQPVDDGVEVCTLAERLLDLAGHRATFHVNADHAQGVQVGNGTIQHNAFH